LYGTALRNCVAGEPVARGGACGASTGVHVLPNALRRLLPALATAAERATDENDDAVSELVVATQLACNCAVGGGADADLVWRAVFPDGVAAVAALRGPAARRAHPPLCMLAHARVMSGGRGREESGEEVGEEARDAVDDDDVVGFRAGRALWSPLLRAACDDAIGAGGGGGGEWLPRFVRAACTHGGERFPALCRSLPRGAADVAAARDDALRRKILALAVDGGGGAKITELPDETTTERFSLTQATLLALVHEEIGSSPPPPPRRDADADAAAPGSAEPPAPSPLSDGALAYLLDMTSRAAAAVHASASASTEVKAIPAANPDDDDDDQPAAAAAVLRESLKLVRRLTELEIRPSSMNTPHDVVTALAAMGLPRLLLGLTAALPPPMGAGNTSKARGPTAAPRLDPDVVGGPAALRDGHAPFPTARPWPGYRVDALAPLANAMFNRPGVCDQVVKLGGVPIILAATRGEDGEDFLREWALWATRNLCHGSEDARKEIESMQPEAAADSQELAAMGLNVSVDPATGKVRVKSIGKEGGAGERYDGVGTGGTGGGGSAAAAATTTTTATATTAGTALGPGELLMTPGGARTPAGRAVAAALMAGFDADQFKDAGDDDDDDVDVPAHWKVADLS